jgi:hypothetical protein
MTHHHTYLKNPYVHIQVFHILHNHTMKSLQVFKSFLQWESIVENQQRKLIHWRPRILQRKPIRCRHQNSAAKTDSLQTTRFGSEN